MCFRRSKYARRRRAAVGKAWRFKLSNSVVVTSPVGTAFQWNIAMRFCRAAFLSCHGGALLEMISVAGV